MSPIRQKVYVLNRDNINKFLDEYRDVSITDARWSIYKLLMFQENEIYCVALNNSYFDMRTVCHLETDYDVVCPPPWNDDKKLFTLI